MFRILTLGVFEEYQTEDEVNGVSPIFRQIAEALSSGRSMVLATVLSRRGSAPQEAGAIMAVDRDGAAAGTIGGGRLEALVCEAAARSFSDRRSVLLNFDLTAAETGEGIMLCGGQMEVLVHYLDAGEQVEVEVFRRLMDDWRDGLPHHLVRSIGIPAGEGAAGQVRIGVGLVRGDRLDPGSLDLTRSDLLRRDWTAEENPVLLSEGALRYFVQPVSLPAAVFIVGAGHVGKALAEVCALLGFRITVTDDRAEFARAGRFPAACKTEVIDSYRDCFRGVRTGPSGAIVVATRGHEHDKEALRAALQTGAGYIGMIASRRKRDIIFAELIREGVAEELLTAVRSPIGMDIGAKTPAEIAVSIAAEMIAFRAKTKRHEPK